MNYGILSVLIASLLGACSAVPTTAHSSLQETAASQVERPSCADTLSADYTRDAHSIHFDHDEFDHEIDHGAAALAVVKLAAGKTGCNASMIELDRAEDQAAKCMEIVAGDSFSNVCFVSTNVGYFIVSETLPNGIAVTWSRWD